MLANLFVIFFVVHLIKKAIDDHSNKSKCRYNGSYIYLNELLFSFVTNVCLIFCYTLSLLANSSDMISFTLGLTISILMMKLNQYKKEIGSKILYCMYILYLLIPFQSMTLDSHEPTIHLSLIGALIVLIPEPVRNIRIAMSSLNKDDNNNFWHMITNIIIFIDFSINFLFKSIINPAFCFVYIRTVPNFYAALIVFLINMVSGMMILVDKLCKKPDTLVKLKEYVPVY